MYENAWDAFLLEFMPTMSNEEKRRYGIEWRGADGWAFPPNAIAFLRGRWEEWGKRPENAGPTVFWGSGVSTFASLVVGPVKFVIGDWFLARPGVDEVRAIVPTPPAGLPKYGVPNHLWFGKIISFVRHTRVDSDGSQLQEDFVETEWHVTVARNEEHPERGGPYSAELQSPIVNAGITSEISFFPARSVVPLRMTAMPASRARPQGTPACWAMIRRDWHCCLGALDCAMEYPPMLVS